MNWEQPFRGRSFLYCVLAVNKRQPATRTSVMCGPAKSVDYRSVKAEKMRMKSENEARDRYARHYAAVLAVDAIIQYRSKTAHTILTIEAEDRPEWDDIVQIMRPMNIEHRHQVKRQQTPLTKGEFGKYIIAAAEGGKEVEYHFGFPWPIEIEEVGHTRVLRTLCSRIRQDGANHGKVIAGLRDGERKWLDALVTWTKLDVASVINLLHRIHIDAIGYEEDLDNRALRLLEPIFGQATQDAWDRVQAFVADKDGVVEIDPANLLQKLPPPAADEIETFYWSFIEEVETRFEIEAWAWLTDHVVRNLVPQEFEDGVYDFVLSVHRAVWPNRYPDLETALENLASRAQEYLAHFHKRSISDGEWNRENKYYQNQFDKSWYQAESDAADAWDKGNVPRLINMVVALNVLFDTVRKCLRPTYRLRNGRLGVHDTLGVRNDGNEAIYYWQDYADIKQ